MFASVALRCRERLPIHGAELRDVVVDERSSAQTQERPVSLAHVDNHFRPTSSPSRENIQISFFRAKWRKGLDSARPLLRVSLAGYAYAATLTM
jgi:hypothetical protein